jgi:hypothetical protein
MTTTTEPREDLLLRSVIDTSLLVYRQSLASEKLGLRYVPGGGRHVDSRGGKVVRPCARQHADWPCKTDMWCWHCCHPFDTQPLPMPIKYDDRRDMFVVTGVFCSWSCMKTYNLESANYMKNVISMFIRMFIKRCTGSTAPVQPAPPRIKLRVFGGSMSIKEFRAASSSGTFRVLPPKMIVYDPFVEHEVVVPRSRQKQCNRDDTVSFKDVRARNETLRLKRPKPLQNNKNALERTIGINTVQFAAA